MTPPAGRGPPRRSATFAARRSKPLCRCNAFSYPLFLCVLALVVAGAALRLTERLDFRILDFQFNILRTWLPKPAIRDVVVVGIDEETAKTLPEPITLWHRHLSKFLAAMAIAKPAVVGVDIVLPDRSYESVIPGSDKLLLQGLLEARRAYPLVLALTVDLSGKPRAIHPPFLTIAGPGSAGYVLFPVDGDGRVRRFDERLGEKGEMVPTFPGQMARRMGVEPQAGLIDFALGARFEYVPFHQVLEWMDRNDSAQLTRAFAGKPVMVGMVLPFTDRQVLPVALAEWDDGVVEAPGVLLHAQALRSMLGPGLVKTVETWIIVLLTVVAALLWVVSGHVAMLIVVYVALTAAAFVSSTWLLAHGWFLPVSVISISGFLALAGRNGYEAVLQLRERRRLRGSFSGYVSPAVMDEILAGRVQPELGGASKFVCVMFSDIRGYTTRSEGMTPENIIRFLNRYFEEVVALIHARGGSVVSFMGDGMMAVFGAPKALENPCREAFQAARSMSQYVAALNEQLRAEGEAPMEIGIGLHAGEAVIGHVGSSTRHDYTAIGDVTNVASRVEGLTKEAGYRIVVSRIVAEQAGDEEELKPLGPMAIKGHTPVDVFGHDKIS